jgi:hypothetical protein
MTPSEALMKTSMPAKKYGFQRNVKNGEKETAEYSR